jgi:hypothetical protein
MDHNGEMVEQLERVRLSGVLAGEDALIADKITTVKGEIKGVSRLSGHHQPQVADLRQFLEKLMSKGTSRRPRQIPLGL